MLQLAETEEGGTLVLVVGGALQASHSSNRETDMQRRSRGSYFDPSVGSDWASLKSICLAGISLAPGNPTGFLRISGVGVRGPEVVRLERWSSGGGRVVDTHSVGSSKRQSALVPGRVCVCVCMLVSWCKTLKHTRRNLQEDK